MSLNIVGFATGPARVNPYVASDVPARIRQRLLECSDPHLIVRIIRIPRHKHADAPHPIARLRTHHERPSRRAAE
jgi:hypothetical protein